jgi:ABC-2 type transport system permease protein
VVKQIVRDRRTLALLFVAPLLVIYLLYAFLNTGRSCPTCCASASRPGWRKPREGGERDSADSLSGALSQLRDRSTDGVIAYDDPTVTVYVEGTDLSVTAPCRRPPWLRSARTRRRPCRKRCKRSSDDSRPAPPSGTASAALSGEALTLPQTDTRVEYLNGSAQTTGFDDIAPLLMGFFIFFFVFLLAGVAFLRERNSGTLDGCSPRPCGGGRSCWATFSGSAGGVPANADHSAVRDARAGRAAEGRLLAGDADQPAAGGGLAFAGTLLSAFARNELQMFQFIPLVIVPQVLFCGLFSLRGAPDWVVWLSKASPSPTPPTRCPTSRCALRPFHGSAGPVHA